jgi:hypothetical protein
MSNVANVAHSLRRINWVRWRFCRLRRRVSISGEKRVCRRKVTQARAVRAERSPLAEILRKGSRIKIAGDPRTFMPISGRTTSQSERITMAPNGTCRISFGHRDVSSLDIMRFSALSLCTREVVPR